MPVKVAIKAITITFLILKNKFIHENIPTEGNFGFSLIHFLSKIR